MSTTESVLSDTLALLSPISCPGCGEPDVSLCVECRGLFDSGPAEVTLAIRRELFEVPVLACADYSGRARAVILGFKDHGHTRLAPALAQALTASLEPVMAQFPHATVVPVPSSWRGALRRGVEPTHLLARAIEKRRPSWRVEGLLRRSLSARAVLSPQSKGLNRRDRLTRDVPLRLLRRVEGEACVLLDDVITTGSTMESCARMIRNAGGMVVGAVALAGRVGVGGLSLHILRIGGDSSLLPGLRWGQSHTMT